MPEGDAAVWCDKNWTYFQNGVFVRVLVNLCVSLCTPDLQLVRVSGSSWFFIFLAVLGDGGLGRQQALVMLLLWVLLGVREVNTLAPEASLRTEET